MARTGPFKAATWGRSDFRGCAPAPGMGYGADDRRCLGGECDDATASAGGSVGRTAGFTKWPAIIMSWQIGQFAGSFSGGNLLSFRLGATALAFPANALPVRALPETRRQWPCAARSAYASPSGSSESRTPATRTASPPAANPAVASANARFFQSFCPRLTAIPARCWAQFSHVTPQRNTCRHRHGSNAAKVKLSAQHRTRELGGGAGIWRYHSAMIAQTVFLGPRSRASGPLRWKVPHRRADDGHLLPAVLRGAPAKAGKRARSVENGRRGAGAGPARLQALPARSLLSRRGWRYFAVRRAGRARARGARTLSGHRGAGARLRREPDQARRTDARSMRIWRRPHGCGASG